jgi:G3E family GTPase
MSDSTVTVLAGFSPAATQAVARALLITDPGLVLLTHDLSSVRDGVVRRTIRTAAEIIETAETRLVHGCVSCTLREDVLPALARLARERPDGRIVLALPPAIEPEAVAAAKPVGVRLDSFVTVVEARAFLDDLTSSDDLRDRGLHAAENDHRAVADVVARQVEFADTIVVWGTPQDDPYDSGRLGTLLHRLAPWATRTRVGDSRSVDCTALAAEVLGHGRHDPARPGMLGRALEGRPIGIHDPAGEYDVGSVLFRSRRPFHPRRLFDALDELTGAVRGRGLFWLASQPGTAIGWESAGGGVQLGNLGHWLAAVPAERWAEASDQRRLAADLDWDPYYGDRRTVLSFVGLGLDCPALTALLRSCLLTDDELAAGAERWPALPDPFDGFFPQRTESVPGN